MVTLAELTKCDPRVSHLPEPLEQLSFEELARLEPFLGVLLHEAQGYHRDCVPNFCANAVWYGYGGYPGIKPRLLALVGWERDDCHPVLATRMAYDVAYDAIYAVLPDCSNCSCWSI